MKIVNTLFLTLVLFVFVGCGGNEATDNGTEGTETTEATTTEEGTTTATTSTETVDIPDSEGASKITDAVVDQACGCLNGSKGEDGSVDFAKMKECMGGKNKIEFVADLLGPDASEKERADAENALDAKMKAKCPMN